MIQEGKPAPAFTLPDQDGKLVSLADFEGKQAVLLYFYPKDDTPGCTKEACGFRDEEQAFEKLGVAVLGVIRSSVLIGKDGTVLRHWPRVAKADEHPAEVLAAAQELLG